jgi:hypothetical protein
MPYSTSVTFLDSEGGPLPTTNVTARLWMLWTEVGGLTTVHRQSDEGTSTFDINKGGNPPSTIAFAKDATFAAARRGVGLSIQDTDQLANDNGWLFRSGRFEDQLPTAPIELVGGLVTVTFTSVSSTCQRSPTAWRQGRAASVSSGVKRSTQR